MAAWSADARYTRLVEEQGTGLLRLAIMLLGNRHDAEDAVQDVLINAASAWPMTQPLAYLRKSVANRCMDIIRKRRDIPTESVPETPISDSGFIRVEEARHFFDLIQDLPPRQRQTIVLRYQFDLSDASIARILGVSVATVRSQAQHALRKLRLSEAVSTGKDLS